MRFMKTNRELVKYGERGVSAISDSFDKPSTERSVACLTEERTGLTLIDKLAESRLLLPFI